MESCTYLVLCPPPLLLYIGHCHTRGGSTRFTLIKTCLYWRNADILWPGHMCLCHWKLPQFWPIPSNVLDTRSYSSLVTVLHGIDIFDFVEFDLHISAEHFLFISLVWETKLYHFTYLFNILLSHWDCPLYPPWYPPHAYLVQLTDNILPMYAGYPYESGILIFAFASSLRYSLAPPMTGRC